MFKHIRFPSIKWALSEVYESLLQYGSAQLTEGTSIWLALACVSSPIPCQPQNRIDNMVEHCNLIRLRYSRTPDWTVVEGFHIMTKFGRFPLHQLSTRTLCELEINHLKYMECPENHLFSYYNIHIIWSVK